MEFFAIANVRTDPATLQACLNIDSLPRYCGAIDKVIEQQGDRGVIYCLWGQFSVHREAIKGGVRFSLTSCPNALAWTVTTGYPPASDRAVIHCTINRTEHEPELVESIESFVSDWRHGLERQIGSALRHGDKKQ